MPFVTGLRTLLLCFCLLVLLGPRTAEAADEPLALTNLTQCSVCPLPRPVPSDKYPPVWDWAKAIGGGPRCAIFTSTIMQEETHS